MRAPTALLVLTTALSPLSLSAQNRFFELGKNATLQDSDNATAIAHGDFDGDGYADLLVGRNSGVLLLLNRGDGTFTDATARLPSNTSWVTGIAVGDLDGDGDLDAVVGNNRAFDQVLINDGQANFHDAATQAVAVGAAATSAVALADLDGDGDLDLLEGSDFTATSFSRYFLNDGTGAFSDPANPRLPDYTTAIAAGDIDGDGDADLALVAAGALFLLQNDGSARFTDVTAGRITAPSPLTRALVLRDLDRDGDLDLLVGAGTGGLLLFDNDGLGHFTDVSTSRLPALGEITNAVQIADLDGDGSDDALLLDVPGLRSGRDRVLLNDGNGHLLDRTQALGYPDPELAASCGDLADLDGNGEIDAVLGARIGRLRFLFQIGGGRLRDADPPAIPADADATTSVAAGDIDGDGDIDVVVGGIQQTLTLEINDGRGRFRDEAAQRLPPGLRISTLVVLLRDIDFDRDLDLIYGEGLLYNDGNGHFTAASPAQLPLNNAVTHAIAAADLDFDGDIDLVFGNQQAPANLYLNNGLGSFTDATAQLPPNADDTRSIAIGDVDGDFDLDIVLGNQIFPEPTPGNPSAQNSGYNRLFLNDGTGHFTDASNQLPLVSAYTLGMLLIDVDGDGDLDLVTANLRGYLQGDFSKLYLNDGSGHFTQSPLLPARQDLSYGVAAADLDDDGDLDLVFANSFDIRASMFQSAQNRVMRNDGTAGFTDVTATWLPAREDFTSGVALFDADGDGDIDVWFGNSANGGGLAEKAQDRFYVNLRQQTVSFGLVRPGRPYDLDFFTALDTAASSVVAVPLLSPGSGRLPLPPLGILGLDPNALLALPPVGFPNGSPHQRLTLPLPPDASLRGFHLFAQTLIGSPAAPPVQWTLTNTVEDTIY